MPEPKRVKIVSDGTPSGTKVTVDGAELLCRRLEIVIDADDAVGRFVVETSLPDTELEFWAIQVEKPADLDPLVCPKCGGVLMGDVMKDFWTCIVCDTAVSSADLVRRKLALPRPEESDVPAPEAE